jgi:hypothetical protein
MTKTQSGKIMYRVLKTIATMGEIGDVMTLANPEVVQAVVDARAKMGEIKYHTIIAFHDIFWSHCSSRIPSARERLRIPDLFNNFNF